VGDGVGVSAVVESAEVSQTEEDETHVPLASQETDGLTFTAIMYFPGEESGTL
jgi:hypothetical protein